LGTNYQKGRSREYKVLHILRQQGWVCTRSAMSHGPVDIVAARHGKVLLIQVKSGKGRMRKDELLNFREWAEHFNADAQIWFFKKRGKVEREVVRERTSHRPPVKAKKRPRSLPEVYIEPKRRLVEEVVPPPIIPSSASLVP
jgi:Holliday junction resolvase